MILAVHTHAADAHAFQLFGQGVRLTKAGIKNPASAAGNTLAGLLHDSEGARMDRYREHLLCSRFEMDTRKAA